MKTYTYPKFVSEKDLTKKLVDDHNALLYSWKINEDGRVEATAQLYEQSLYLFTYNIDETKFEDAITNIRQLGFHFLRWNWEDNHVDYFICARRDKFIAEADLELIMSQVKCTKLEAIEAWYKHDHDIVNAIIFLQERSH